MMGGLVPTAAEVPVPLVASMDAALTLAVSVTPAGVEKTAVACMGAVGMEFALKVVFAVWGGVETTVPCQSAPASALVTESVRTVCAHVMRSGVESTVLALTVHTIAPGTAYVLPTGVYAQRTSLGWIALGGGVLTNFTSVRVMASAMLKDAVSVTRSGQAQAVTLCFARESQPACPTVAATMAPVRASLVGLAMLAGSQSVMVMENGDSMKASG